MSRSRWSKSWFFKINLNLLLYLWTTRATCSMLDAHISLVMLAWICKFKFQVKGQGHRGRTGCYWGHSVSQTHLVLKNIFARLPHKIRGYKNTQVLCACLSFQRPPHLLPPWNWSEEVKTWWYVVNMSNNCNFITDILTWHVFLLL